MMKIASRLALLILLMTILIPVTAIAAPPQASGTITVSGDLTFGGEAVVTSVVDPEPKKGVLYTTVVCSQGGTVVYQWTKFLGSEPSPQTYPLVDQPGQGLEWVGGTATCEAWLINRVEQGNNTTINVLDTASFTVSG